MQFVYAALFLLLALAPSTSVAITIDGNTAEWLQSDRLDLPPPFVGPAGTQLFNTYETATAAYVLGIKSQHIVANSAATIYINSDRNAATGYKVFGSTGGVEFVIQLTALGTTAPKAALYRYSNFTTGATVLAANLTVKSMVGGVELLLPRALMTASPTAINLLVAINNSVYLPYDYSLYQYTAKAAIRPVRTDFNKRIGIVYSATTAAKYFDMKAYSQLFMAVQHQIMMAGIPFDLLTEDEVAEVANLVNYDVLVFPLFSHVKTANRVKTEEALTDASFRYGIGLITSGDFLTNNETGAPLNPTPYKTQTLLFGVAPVAGGNATTVNLLANDITHPVMKGYAAGALLRSYKKTAYTNPIYHVYEPVAGITNAKLVRQQVNTETVVRSGVVATITGGRNIHYGTDTFLGDTDLLWSGIRWMMNGGVNSAFLQMSRHKSIFFGRNDVDQAKVYDEYSTVYLKLVALLDQWKTKYNFVGSYYIDIGNNPAIGEYTDWVRNAPAYKALIAKGNEIGNHSYTHSEGRGPANENYAIKSDTNKLTDAQLKFEFATSNTLLQQKLGVPVTGAAVPGMPDTLPTALKIEQFARFAHLTGGFSGIDYSLGVTLGETYRRNEGAGFHGAFGYLTPTSSMIYFSPNLTPDFTMIEFRKLTPAVATTIWRDQYTDLNKYASQPIIQLAWHDYSATTGLTEAPKYTVAMFEDTIKLAYTNDSEFVTGADLTSRIQSQMATAMTVAAANPLDVTVRGSGLGAGSLQIERPKGSTQVISSVGAWYAYNDTRVFLPEAGGRFVTTLGAAPADVTRISALPMRARLVSASGNGTNLDFTFKGEGSAVVTVKNSMAATAKFTGANSVVRSGNKYTLKFTTNGTHVVTVRP